MTKAIRYFRPDMLFAITPWHLARECDRCQGIGGYDHGSPEEGYEYVWPCDECDGAARVAACGYTPPEGWRAEVKERGPRCVECEEMIDE